MYDFEFDARKLRARSALPTSGRKLLEEEFSGLYGPGYNSALRESVGRSLSIARDVIRESSVEPPNYYNAYATARRERLNQIAESTGKFDEEVEDYMRSPSKRYYSYNIAPQRDTGRGFWWPYYSYPYTSLLSPARASSRIPQSFFDSPSSFGTRSRPDSTYGGGYYRPSPSQPRKSYYTPRTYEPPTSSSFSRKPFTRYSHYYIPRHYPGTPMIGGYLFPVGGTYGWRY